MSRVILRRNKSTTPKENLQELYLMSKYLFFFCLLAFTKKISMRLEMNNLCGTSIGQK
jgi:hypothetical protein